MPEQKVTGHPEAVAGLPRHRAAGRFVVNGCCSLLLGPQDRAEPVQGIDSTIYDVIGPGYTVGLIFGPYEASEAGAGYVREDELTVDDVRLVEYRQVAPGRPPPEPTLLWITEVSGGARSRVIHTPNVLRIDARCDSDATCQAARELVGTIRF